MNGVLNIEIRISRDGLGNHRFTKEEVEELVKTNNIKFVRNILCRISDGKVVGEIKKYKIS